MKKETMSGQTNTRNNTTDNHPMQESLLDKLFNDLLKDMYWAEKHLLQALPLMQKAATTNELHDAFEDHLLQTQKHVIRLERVFKLLGKPAETKKCEAMAGLTEEAKSLMRETKEGTMTRDVALIVAAQKVEHYEIATYGSLVQLARTMDCDEVATILEETLWEEEDADHHLTHIAETYVNPLSDQEDESTAKKEAREPAYEPAEEVNA
ncbi:YciE/YciF ferroxidase family protein [Sediminibacterium soli]|uniref:YciE/YciF ferroxidase family protein n=1 Tax=Sediminibacterium soli TaxID=2698829 RepID=UPI00137AD935|nr:ferritin-like domain-containing protein [Sediminibacterium soli]NCI45643.1 ferritin-like domain-containing protein [Sediminibacterium soli]